MTIERKLGVVIGGSGLLGGSIVHYFKKKTNDEIDVLAPNSKKLSLREPDDITAYFKRYRPDFIVNSAIAAIDSAPQLAYETNYLGSVNLARVALAFKIPYIHLSTAATMPSGYNITEESTLPLSAELNNYAKSKLLTELSLKHLKQTQGLDYTVLRLGIVYGKHDHKIQGFHRLLFSIMNKSMLVMLTKKDVMHSYSSSRKLPHFVHYILENRKEFSGETINFVDRNPVKLSQLIITIKSLLGIGVPKEIYLPYFLARFGKSFIKALISSLNHIGVEARMPAEVMFMEHFYKTQTLSSEKFNNCSYADPYADHTVFTCLPDLIEYYLTRWEHLNLVSRYNLDFYDPKHKTEKFVDQPQELLEETNREATVPLSDLVDKS
mgnify:CR=1 FL=1